MANTGQNFTDDLMCLAPFARHGERGLGVGMKQDVLGSRLSVNNKRERENIPGSGHRANDEAHLYLPPPPA